MNNLCRHHYHRSVCSWYFLSFRTKYSCAAASKPAGSKTNGEDMPKVMYSLAPALGHHQRLYGTHDNNLRISYILNALEKAKLTPEFRGSEISQLTDIRKATMEDITSIHSRSYYSFLEKAVEDAKASEDGTFEIEESRFPTHVTGTTLNDSLIAAGAGLSLVDAVVAASRISENPPIGFSLIRPPGHHASRDGAMGGCIFNNVSVVTRYAQRTHGLKRVFIIDFDAHHGNGTSDAFYDDPYVFYLSTHQDGCYPIDTGKFDDVGCGNGEGATLNLPLPELSGDIAMQSAFDQVIVPAAQRFKPDIILVSAGYTGYLRECLSSEWQMTTRACYMLADGIKQLSKDLCGGRCVFFLEGGWEYETLKFCIVESFRAFIGEPSMPDEYVKNNADYLKDEPSSKIKQAIQRVKNLHSL